MECLTNPALKSIPPRSDHPAYSYVGDIISGKEENPSARWPLRHHKQEWWLLVFHSKIQETAENGRDGFSDGTKLPSLVLK